MVISTLNTDTFWYLWTTECSCLKLLLKIGIYPVRARREKYLQLAGDKIDLNDFK